MAYVSSLLTLALIGGLAGGVTVDLPYALGMMLLMSASWAAALLAFLRGHAVVQLAAVCTLVSGAGWVLGAHTVERALHSPLRDFLERRLGGFALDDAPGAGRTDTPVLLEGRLREDATLTDGGAVLRVEVTHVWLGENPERVSGGVSIGVGGQLQVERTSEWTAGRMVRLPAALRRPATYLNDGVPDQERVLARRGVSLVGTVKSAALVEVVRRGRWWEEWAAAVRERTREALRRHVTSRSDQSAAIAIAILIGDRAGLALAVERRLQEAGTYHVIAISGGNIAILAGILLGALALVGLRGKVAWLVVIGAIAAYGIVAAGGPSVLRATLMAIVYLAVRVMDLRTATANAVSLTAAIILLVNPLQILDVGFWFTFGATIALVCAASVTFGAFTLMSRQQVAPHARWLVAKGVRALVAVLVGTACAELALAPIGALVFQRVTLAGLLLNVLALPAMTIVQLGALTLVALDVFGCAAGAGWAGAVVHGASVVLTDSTDLLDVAPWLTWRVPSPGVGVLMAYYTTLCVAVTSMWMGLSRVVLHTSSVVAALLFAWMLASPEARVRATGDGRLHLTMFDVGQGDAILVTFPNGKRLVVDTGGVPRGTFDIGDRVLGPALRARKLLSFDYLAITHGDRDHVGGARALVRDFAPREVWWGVPVANDESAAILRDEAERQRAAWRTVQRGDVVHVGGVEVRLHHPPPPAWERQRVRNNDSLVMELRVGEVSFVLTGDIDRDVERELLAWIEPLPIVVLKVAHHGSGTSSSHEFLHRVRPKVALVGVGRGNTYGHPAPYVMGRLQDVDAEVFRTDLDGQIDVATDGQRVDVKTWTGREYQWNARPLR